MNTIITIIISLFSLYNYLITKHLYAFDKPLDDPINAKAPLLNWDFFVLITILY